MYPHATSRSSILGRGNSKSQKSKSHPEGIVQRTTFIAHTYSGRTHSDTPRQDTTCVWAVANDLVGFRCIDAPHASLDTDVELWSVYSDWEGRSRDVYVETTVCPLQSSYTALFKTAMDDCHRVRLYETQHGRSNLLYTTDSIVNLCTPLIADLQACQPSGRLAYSWLGQPLQLQILHANVPFSAD